MKTNLVSRYWFLVGNYDAFLGRMDWPPCTIGKGENAYRRGYSVGATQGRFYRGHWPR